MKVIAYYLPQFHEIPENNKWWGKGFTEWENVKKAQPLFENHEQPKIPLNNNYYDLSDVNVMRWQASIAKENGLYGFCFYHYWFYQKPLLEKPLINYLNARDINFPYCLCWANESWTNGWARADSRVIMEQQYGDKTEWKKHFEFLLPFFKDCRYIKENNKPLVVIYRPYLYDHMTNMMDYWNELAKEAGFAGIKFASQRYENPENNKVLYEKLDYHIQYQPSVARTLLEHTKKPTLVNKFRSKVHDIILQLFNKDISIRQSKQGPVKVDYDIVWNEILSMDPKNRKEIAGAFVNWDNTPRHKRRGSVFVGVTPEKFESYMIKQIDHVKRKYSTDYIFLFAWNEWGEGGYMEPDENHKYAYLTALKNALLISDDNR